MRRYYVVCKELPGASATNNRIPQKSGTVHGSEVLDSCHPESCRVLASGASTLGTTSISVFLGIKTRNIWFSQSGANG
jgi:hypothetical protein